MKIYDCRPDNSRAPGAVSFPVPVEFRDPATGKKIRNVFFACTNPPRIGRFMTADNGEVLVRATGRKIRGKRMNLYTADQQLIARDHAVRGSMAEYERLDIFEDRPWVAVSLATGAVIDRSEGAGA